METKAGARSGRWSTAEQIVFLQGLRKYGKGQWKQIGRDIPTRSLIQIKSHAQKVLKKMDAGEDVYRVLDTDADPTVDYTSAILNEAYTYQAAKKKRTSTKSTRKKPSPKVPTHLGYPQHYPQHLYTSYVYDSTPSSHHSGSEDEDAAHALSYLHQSPCDGPQPSQTDRVPPLSLDDQTFVTGGDSSCSSSVGSLSSFPVHPSSHPLHHMNQTGVGAGLGNSLLPPPYPVSFASSVVAPCRLRTTSAPVAFVPHMVVPSRPSSSSMGDAEILLSLFTSSHQKTTAKKSESGGRGDGVVGAGGVKRMRSPLLEENGQNRKASSPPSTRNVIGGARSPMIKT